MTIDILCCCLLESFVCSFI